VALLKRNDIAANLVLGALSVALLVLLLWQGFSESRKYEREAFDRSYQYARNAEREIAKRCVPPVTTDGPRCAEEAKEAAREYQRKEQDLAAQRVSAWWTSVMGAAAIFGAVLSALGVFLVWTTFRETRKANVIAMADRRPALHPEAVNFRVEGDTIKAEIPLKNFGQSDAENVSFTAAISFGPYPLPKYPPPFPSGYSDPSGKMPPGACAASISSVLISLSGLTGCWDKRSRF